MMNKNYGIFAGITILLVSVYFYQVPLKKNLAEKKLYELLETRYGLDNDQISISNTLKDYKSARGGITIFFSVEGSYLNYQYDYSFKLDNWLESYIEDGVTISCNKIIFDKYK